MPDAVTNAFEIERRSILFKPTTTMPDDSSLGYDGDPNSAINGNTDGESLIYNSPIGTAYQQSTGEIWDKKVAPNSWIERGTGEGGSSVSPLSAGPGIIIEDDIISTEVDGFNILNSPYLTLSETGVVSGQYEYATLEVDAYGRIKSIESGDTPLLASNNFSDVENISSSQANLEVYSMSHVDFLLNSLDISDLYTTLRPLSGDYVMTETSSVVIPVDTRTGPITVTLNESVQFNTRVRIHDSFENAATNPVIIKNGYGTEIGKLNTNGGAIEFAWSYWWFLIDRFENIWNRDEISGEVFLDSENDTLVAGLLKAGQRSETYSGNVTDGDYGSVGPNIYDAGAYYENRGVPIPFDMTGTPTNGNNTTIQDGVLTGQSAAGYSIPWTHYFDLDSLQTYERIWLWVSSVQGGFENVTITISTADDLAFTTNVVVRESGTYDAAVGEAIIFDTSAYPAHQYVRIQKSDTGSLWLSEIQFTSAATTDNTFDRLVYSGTATNFNPSSLVVKDSVGSNILGSGKVNVAYSIDGGSFSSLIDLDEFRGLSSSVLAGVSQLDLRFQPVGAQTIADDSISLAETYTYMDSAGLHVIADGTMIAEIASDGSITAKSGSFGVVAVDIPSTVADYENVGVNVIDNATYYENKENPADTTFNDGNYNTDNTTPYVVTDAGSAFAAPWYAFDGTTAEDWVSGTIPAFVKIDLGSGQTRKFVSVRMYMQSVGAGLYPVNWEVRGSNNDSDWDTLYSAVGSTWTGNAWSGLFDFTSADEYRYYQIYVSTSEGSRAHIGEIDFREGDAATTDNTFDWNVVSGSGNIAPSTLALTDDVSATINGTGKVNVAYSVDGGAFTSLIDLESFRTMALIPYTTEFKLQFQLVGDQTLSGGSIAPPSSNISVSDAGLNFMVAGSEVVSIESDGSINAKSGNFGVNAVAVTSIVDDYDNVGGNVEDNGDHFANNQELSGTNKLTGNVTAAIGNGHTFYGPLPPERMYDGDTGTYSNLLGFNDTVDYTEFELTSPVTFSAVRMFIYTGARPVVGFHRLDYSVDNGSNWSTWDATMPDAGVGGDTPFVAGTEQVDVTDIRVYWDSDGQADTYVTEFELLDYAYATTLNTFDWIVASGAGNITPSTLIVNDKDDAPINGAGKVNVAYSIDGGSFSSLVDIETFRGISNITYTTEFVLQFQLVGAETMSSGSISPPSSNIAINQTGFTFVQSGEEVSQISSEGTTFAKLNTTSRDGILNPDLGQTIFNTDVNEKEYFNGQDWIGSSEMPVEISGSATTSVDAISGNLGRGCIWDVRVSSGTNVRVSTVMAAWDADIPTEIQYNEVSTNDVGVVGSNIELSAIIDGASVALNATINSGTWDIVAKRSIL